MEWSKEMRERESGKRRQKKFDWIDTRVGRLEWYKRTVKERQALMFLSCCQSPYRMVKHYRSNRTSIWKIFKTTQSNGTKSIRNGDEVNKIRTPNTPCYGVRRTLALGMIIIIYDGMSADRGMWQKKLIVQSRWNTRLCSTVDDKTCSSDSKLNFIAFLSFILVLPARIH